MSSTTNASSLRISTHNEIPLSSSAELPSHRPVSWTFSSASELVNLNGFNIKSAAPLLAPHPSRPATPVRAAPAATLIHSPSLSLLILASGPPSPVPRDDIIEGMSASTSSIFERDVELHEPSLTAHEAIELAVPPVLDEAFEVLATTDPKNIIPCTPPLKRPGRGWSASDSSPVSEPPLSLGQLSSGWAGAPPDRSSPTALPSNLPGLYHQLNSASDAMSISDLSSPRSLSPIPSDGVGSVNMSPQRRLASGDKVNSQGTSLNFMSYADLINSERLADHMYHNSLLGVPEYSPSVPSDRSHLVRKGDAVETLGLAIHENGKA